MSDIIITHTYNMYLLLNINSTISLARLINGFAICYENVFYNL